MNPRTEVPTIEDWGVLTSLDSKRAFRDFSGKSVEDMIPTFKDFPLEALSDLNNMPPKVFQYYVFCFVPLLKSGKLDPRAADTAALAYAFLAFILNKLTEKPRDILPIIDELLPVAEYVALNQEQFQTETCAFGSFEDIYELIRERLPK